MKNCINCGAPIEHNTTKCPYCNTSYFDFTNIDFDNKDSAKQYCTLLEFANAYAILCL